MSAGGATNISVGVEQQVDARRTPRARARSYSRRAARGRLGLGVGHREAALDLRARGCRRRARRAPRSSSRWTPATSRMNAGVVPTGSGNGERAPPREHAAAAVDAARAPAGRRSSRHATPTETSLGSIGSTAKPGTSASISSTQPRDVARHRPGVVEARREREARRRSARARSVGLKPAIPQHAAGIRIEPPESVPRPTSTSPAAIAAAVPPLEPPDVRPGAAGFGTVP